MTSACLPGIGWKHSRVIVEASTAFESMISGEFVFGGEMGTLTKLKSSIITESALPRRRDHDTRA